MSECDNKVKTLLLEWVEKEFNTDKDFPEIIVLKDSNKPDIFDRIASWLIGFQVASIPFLSACTIGAYSRFKNIIYIKDRGEDNLEEMKITIIHELLHYVEKKLKYTPIRYCSSVGCSVFKGKTRFHNPVKFLEAKGYLESEMLVEGAVFYITGSRNAFHKKIEYPHWYNKIKLSPIGKLLSYMVLTKEERGQLNKIPRYELTNKYLMMIGYYLTNLIKSNDQP